MKTNGSNYKPRRGLRHICKANLNNWEQKTRSWSQRSWAWDTTRKKDQRKQLERKPILSHICLSSKERFKKGPHKHVILNEARLSFREINPTWLRYYLLWGWLLTRTQSVLDYHSLIGQHLLTSKLFLWSSVSLWSVESFVNSSRNILSVLKHFNHLSCRIVILRPNLWVFAGLLAKPNLILEYCSKLFQFSK